MDRKTVFVFSANSPAVIDPFLSAASPDINIFFTAASVEDASLLKQKLSETGSEVGYSIFDGHNLADIASAVVDCAEKFGGIDLLLFGEWEKSEDRLFLDIEDSEFVRCTDMLLGFFRLCRCAVPYMIGRDGAAIALPTDNAEPASLISGMYRSASLAMVRILADELSGCGIDVKALPATEDSLTEAFLNLL
ncbi:MAG: SDR family oxidoreductase [Synergistaceae bacterium]|nr:SDR family oxidoreductase [Synergistaceae bacterium]